MNAPLDIVAELRDLVKETCPKCAAGIETTEDGQGRRYHYGTESTTPCPASVLHVRIAEIEGRE